MLCPIEHPNKNLSLRLEKSIIGYVSFVITGTELI